MLEHKCSDCGTEISSSAVTCPKCGAIKPSAGWPKLFGSRHPVISGILALVVLAFGGYALVILFSLFLSSCTAS